MWRYKLKRIPKRKIVVWATLIFLCSISLLLMGNFYATGNNAQTYATPINGKTITVNTLNEDWNYYQSLNFTSPDNRNTNLTKLAKKEIYTKNNLVKVQINYDGRDINKDSRIGRIGAYENQNNLVYYQYVPLEKGATYLKIPLIDNPYTFRPFKNENGKNVSRVFNGWVCDTKATGGIPCDKVKIYHDNDYYVRYAYVKVSDLADSNGEKSAIINLRVSWSEGVVATVIDGEGPSVNFKPAGMQALGVTREKIKEVDANICTQGAAKEGLPYYEKTIPPCNNPNFEGCETCRGVWSSERKRYVEDPEYNTTNGARLCYHVILTEEEYKKLYGHVTMLQLKKQIYNENNPDNFEYDFSSGYKKGEDTFPVCTITKVAVTVPEQHMMDLEDGDSLAGFFYLKYPNGHDFTNEDATSYYDANGTSCTKTSCMKKPVFQLLTGNETEINKYDLQEGESFTKGVTSCETTIGKVKKCEVQKQAFMEDGQPAKDQNGNFVFVKYFVYANDIDNYRYLSTRDTNILDIGDNEAEVKYYDQTNSYKSPLTITSNPIGLKKNGYIRFNDRNGWEFKNDVVIENLSVYYDRYGWVAENRIFLNANFNNIKIGREVTPLYEGTRYSFYRIDASGKNTVSNKHNKVIIESGNYNMIRASTANSTNCNTILQLGSDYDKVTKNDELLLVTDKVVGFNSANHRGSIGLPDSEMIVKSGLFGYDALQYGYRSRPEVPAYDYFTTGIYVGGISGGNTDAYHTIKVEGGRIYNINGGPCVDNPGIVVGIYINGGLIDNIVGGAGTSETYGDRIIALSGGTVINSVAGGSNSYYAESNPGPVKGNTLVYVGGNAILGEDNPGFLPLRYEDSNRDYEVYDTLYGTPKRGNVYGSGLGNSGYSGTGVVYGTKLIVNGGTINGDVYGGGNLGSIQSQLYDNVGYDANIFIEILDGTINGSVFGDSNNAGISSASNIKSGHIKIDVKGGTIKGNLYGGSRGLTNNEIGYNPRYTTSDATVEMNLGDFIINGDVFGGGKGAVTEINQNVTINVNPSLDEKLRIRNIYAGSEFGDLNKRATINVNGGIINKVYGGGKGSGNKNEPYSPDLWGGSTLNINSGQIENVYGGHDQSGYFPYKETKILNSGAEAKELIKYSNEELDTSRGYVYVNGGIIGNVYGGGRGVNSTSLNTNVIVDIPEGKGKIDGDVYGGGDEAYTIVAQSQILNGDIYGNAYGGGKTSDSNVTVLNVEGGKFVNKDTSPASISTQGSVFGGGFSGGANYTHVYVKGGDILYVFGGSNESGVVGHTEVEASSELGKQASVCSIFGGGNDVNIKLGNVTVKAGFELKMAPTDKDDYSNKCGNVYAGDNFQTPRPTGSPLPEHTYNAAVNIYGHVVNVFGGSNANGTVNESDINLYNGAVAANFYGGSNDGGSTIKTMIKIHGGNITGNVYAGGKGVNTKVDEATVTSAGNIAGSIYGAGNNGPVIKSSSVLMTGGNTTHVFGGGNHSFVGDAKVDGKGEFIGGGPNGFGQTNVKITGGTIRGNVYGSGNSSFVYGDTTINIGEPGNTAPITIGGSIFGGSETNSSQDIQFDFKSQGVIGNAKITINPGGKFNFEGSIFGSGNNSVVSGASKINILNVEPVDAKAAGTAKPHQIASIQRATEVHIRNSQIEIFGARDRAVSEVFKKSIVRVDKLYLEGNDASNGSHLYLLSGVKYLGEYHSGFINGKGNFVHQTISPQQGGFNTKGDNRLFLNADTIMAVSNTAKPQYEYNASGPGPVRGMTYFGMYEHDVNDQHIIKGQYDEDITIGDVLKKDVYGVIEDKYSFVYGKNEQPNISYDAQRKTHGFYSQYLNEKTGKVTTNYVSMEPKENYTYYKWILGEEKLEVNIDLEANKYSENGTSSVSVSLPQLKEQIGNNLVDWQDAVMTIKSVDDKGFVADLKQSTKQFKGFLVDKNDIKTIATSDKNNDGVVDANNYFALTMGTTTAGWMGNYRSDIYSPNGPNADTICTSTSGCSVGDSIYIYDSTRNQRALSFWLYHSKNLDFQYAVKEKEEDLAYIPMGVIKINVEFYNVHGDAGSTSSLVPVTINVRVALTDGDLDTYGAKIAPGKQYDSFPPIENSIIPSDGAISIYQSLALDLTKEMANVKGQKWSVEKLYNTEGDYEVFDKVSGQYVTKHWGEAYRYLASSYLFPVGTKITMIDLKNKEEYYYEVTQHNYNAMKNMYDSQGEYKYLLEDFIRMGSTSNNNKYDDNMKGKDSKKYYYHDSKNELAVEEFIFTVNFEEVSLANRTKNPLKPYLYMSIARKVGEGDTAAEETVLLPKGIPQKDMVYQIVPDVNSKLETIGGFVGPEGNLTNNTDIYVGQSADLKLTTSLKQYDSLGNQLNNVSDSKYDNYKLGALISVLRTKLDQSGQEMTDSKGNVLYEKVTTDLFGTIVKINGKEYYPQTDGSIRIELAGRVSNVISDVQIDFSNSSLDHRRYKLVVETFVTYDGLYYGDFKPTYNEYDFELLSNQYGIDFDIKPSEVTHDMNTGLDVNGNKVININLYTKNGLKSPNIKISLERKQNNGMGYEVRDLKDIFSSVKLSNKELLSSCYNATGSVCNMYNMGSILSSIDPIEHKLTFTLKEGPSATDLADKNNAKWKSGTYRLVFTMYDGDTPIGSVYDYIIIRSLNVGEDIEGSK